MNPSSASDQRPQSWARLGPTPLLHDVEQGTTSSVPSFLIRKRWTPGDPAHGQQERLQAGACPGTARTTANRLHPDGLTPPTVRFLIFQKVTQSWQCPLTGDEEEDSNNNNTSHHYCHSQKLQSSSPPSDWGSPGKERGPGARAGCLDLNPHSWELCNCRLSN